MTRAQRTRACISYLFAALLFWQAHATATAQTPTPIPPPSEQSADIPTELLEALQLYKQSQSLYEASKYAEALPPAERAFALSEKVLGADHPEVSVTMSHVALLYKMTGDYERAAALYQRALRIREKVYGAAHTEVATALNRLALVYLERGDYVEAEPLFQRALGIRERTSGADSPELSTLLNNLATLYVLRGDNERARPLLMRSLAIEERVLGADHLSVASTLNNLAELYKSEGELERAEPLLVRALDIRRKALGEEHTSTALTMNNLAALYHARGDIRRALPLTEKVLAIRERLFDREHPDVTTSVNNLGALYTLSGEYERAEQLYLRALAADEKRLGARHPSVVTGLTNLAALHIARGDGVRAVEFMERAEEGREHNLALNLFAGSERQKLAYLTTLGGETNAVVSLHANYAPRDARALKLALTTILRRKGRALDAMADQIAALRRRLAPEDKVFLEQLSAAQSRLSALVLGGTTEASGQERAASIRRLEAEIERLQDTISRRSAGFAVRAPSVTTASVQGLLGDDAALVEFVAYKPYDPKSMRADERFGALRYIAYVLRRQGEPLWVDLGAAREIDAGVVRLRDALKRPASKNFKEAARALDEAVMRPVRRLAGDARHLFISPDGALNLIPFAALVDEDGKYLLERYPVTYLTSGRDLLRLQSSAESSQPPLVIADPLFGTRGANAVAPERGAGVATRSADMGQMSFTQLPGTAEEALSLGSTLPGVRVLTREQATEAALKGISSPRVLHVATHGFFLPDVAASAAAAGARSGGAQANGENQPAARIENPLLRSGLALEGANRRQGVGGEDGILTALEVAALDLWGTKLVVLSACETGVGEVKNGEGVYGLRRALVLAGAEAQVMSLWQVSDEATRDLMVAYYKRLMKGEGRTEALRQVQLEMLRGGMQEQGGAERGVLGKQERRLQSDRSHPFYWAAFIQSGDWRAMQAPRTASR